MSVDDRIRSAFAETDESWALQADAALRQVGRRHARGVLVRRGLAAGVLAAAVVTGIALVASDGLGGDAAPGPLRPAPSPTPTQANPAPTQTVLEGRWRSPLLHTDDLRAALEQSGDGQYADDVVPGLRPVPFRLLWVVTHGTAELRMVSEDGSEALDKIFLSVEGDQATMTPRFANGAAVHRFAVTGNELRLTFGSTTEGLVDGVPGEVWQRLLYDAFPFARR